MPVWNWGQPLDGIMQVAYVVPDIHAAMHTYQQRLNLGPWFLFEHFEFQWLEYRGREATLDVTLALANSGSMTFELIQQNDDTPSAYREIVEKRGYGFHHLAIAAPPAEYDATVARYRTQGYDLVFEGAVGVGARASYVDTTPDLGGMLEIIEVTPPVEWLFTHVRHASVGWDRVTEPVRVLAPPGR